MIPGVNYVIYGWSFERTTPPELNTGGKYCRHYSRQCDIDDNLKRQIKNQTLCTRRLLLLT